MSEVCRRKHWKQEASTFWNNGLWTDETKIELVGHPQRRYVWRKKGEAFVEKNTLPTVKHGGGSIMVWGCVEARGAENIVWVERRMDSTKYQDILEANVQRLAARQGTNQLVGSNRGLCAELRDTSTHWGRDQTATIQLPDPCSYPALTSCLNVRTDRSPKLLQTVKKI